MESLTNSMISLSWAAFIFSVKQTATLLNLQSSGQSVEDEVTDSTTEIERQLRGEFDKAFKAGESLADSISRILPLNFGR